MTGIPTTQSRSLRDIPDDRIQHVTDQRDACWCQPRTEFVEGGAIIIHEVEQ